MSDDRHHECRWGRFTPAYQAREPDRGWDAAGVAHLCVWPIPDTAPPAIRKVWGGLVDPSKDCAICKAFEPLPAQKDSTSE